MTTNEYILGLMAIVSGLAITEWIGSLYRLLAARNAVKWDWLAAIAAAFSVYVVLRSWWISWHSFGPETDLTLGQMAWNLSQLAFLFLATRASLPESAPETGTDLKRHYALHSWLIWGGVSASATMLVANNVMHDWRQIYLLWQLELALVAGILLAFIPLRRLHAILVPLVVVFYVSATLSERMIGN